MQKASGVLAVWGHTDELYFFRLVSMSLVQLLTASCACYQLIISVDAQADTDIQQKQFQRVYNE